jgi:hypothetical protein
MHSHTIFETERLVLFKFSGTLDHQTLMDSLRALFQDPKFSREYDGVTDLRSVLVKMTPDEVRAAAKKVASDQAILGRWAILIDEPRGTALATLYMGALAGQHPLRVFSTTAGVSEYLKRDLGMILPA